MRPVLSIKLYWKITNWYLSFDIFDLLQFCSLSTQEHYMSAKEMRKLLCEFINSILTDLDAGEEN